MIANNSMAQAVLGTVLDIILFAMPARMIWKLRMVSASRRMFGAGLLSLGAL